MRIILLIIAVCLGVASQAEQYCVDGIYYSVISETDKEVSVRCPNEFYENNPYNEEFYNDQDIRRFATVYPFMAWDGNAYSGEIVVPSTVVIPELGDDEYTVTEIGEGAFCKCEGLTTVTLPETIREVKRGAFYYCSSLTSMYLNDEITQVGSCAFYGCSKMHTLHFPLSCDKIEDRVLTACGADDDDFQLSGIENVGAIGDYGMAVCGLKEFPYMPLLHYLGHFALSDTSMETIDLSYLDVGYLLDFPGAVGGSKLKKVYLPTNCREREDFLRILAPSRHLEYIQVYDVEPSVLTQDWAPNYAKNCELVVPDESVEKYKSAPFWQNFYSIRGVNNSVETLKVPFVKNVYYYDLSGCRVEEPSTGLYICVTEYADGRISRKKIAF